MNYLLLLFNHFILNIINNYILYTIVVSKKTISFLSQRTMEVATGRHVFLSDGVKLENLTKLYTLTVAGPRHHFQTLGLNAVGKA